MVRVRVFRWSASRRRGVCVGFDSVERRLKVYKFFRIIGNLIGLTEKIACISMLETQQHTRRFSHALQARWGWCSAGRARIDIYLWQRDKEKVNNLVKDGARLKGVWALGQVDWLVSKLFFSSCFIVKRIHQRCHHFDNRDHTEVWKLRLTFRMGWFREKCWQRSESSWIGWRV